MRKNHHGKKDKLVKRVFALCLALAVICTCLVPVFATEYKEVVDSGDEVAGFGGEEATRPVDGGEAAGFGEEEASRPVDGGEAAGFGEEEVSRPVDDEGSEDNPGEGGTVTDSEWGTVIEYDTSSSTGTQWSGEDDVVAKPDDKVVVSGDEIKKLQDMVVYRFWLKELNANDLKDITAQAQINNMTESEYLARNGEVLWNLYFIQAVPRAETIADYSSYIENPSSNRDPKGELRLFDYWYTLDEFGNRVRLNLTDPTSNILDDKTTTVNVYAAWKDGTVGSDEEEDVDHEDLVDKNPVPVTLDAKASASYEDEEGNLKTTTLPVEVKNLPSAADHLSVIHMGDDDMESFYKSHSNDFGSMAPILGLKISPKNAKGKTVQPAKGEKATVTVSGLDKLPEMEGATADTLKVLHQTSDDNVEILDVLTYTNGTLTFETSSFSPFVVVRTDGYAVNTLKINRITKVSIKDDIANSGHYVLKITADGNEYEGAEAGKLLKENGFTVTWEKGGTVVNRLEVTNGVYSREENGGWVDVVYTDGANLTYTVTIAKDTQSLNDSLTVNYNDELKNGGFEDELSNGTDQINADTAPNLVWKTTAITGGQHKIEIGNTKGMTSVYELQANGDKWDNVQLSNTAKAYGCASANTGDQFAELNAEGAGALYQDVLTKPGQPMNWRFYHRARTRRGYEDQSKSVIQSGADTMAMVIAPLELVKDVTTQAQLESLLAECINHNGENHITKNNKRYTVYVYEATAAIEDLSGTRKWDQVNCYAKYSTSSWTESSDTYKIPDGQYLTRFFFAAISTASDDDQTNQTKTMGNLLDDVWFSQNVAPPTSGTGRVTVTKKFYGLTEAEAKTLGNSGFISYNRSVAHRGIADQALTAVDFSGDIWTNGYDDENGPYVSVSHVFDEVVEANTDYTYYFKEDVKKADVSGYKLTRTLVDGIEGKNGSVTMSKENSNRSITFSNFYEKKTADVTLTKHVTGLMGDTHKEFAFRITGLEGKGATLENGNLSNFTLTHNGSVTLKNVPMDTVFAVVETLGADSGYETKATGHDTDATRTFYYKLVLEDGEQKLMACDADGSHEKAQNELAITVTNHCTLKPDTGVLLDTLPYIVILAVVVGGGILLMLRKRRKNDD
ncbi:DUF7601 domain-containing protein [Faecalibacterium duncaniae]